MDKEYVIYIYNSEILLSHPKNEIMPFAATWMDLEIIILKWSKSDRKRRIIWYHLYAAATAKSLQSCPTLCDPIDGSSLGSSVPGILQARILEWVAISFSNAWKWKVKVKLLSHAWLLATPWTAAYQASPSMGFSRQEYWSGVPLPSPSLIYGALKKMIQTNLFIYKTEIDPQT